MNMSAFLPVLLAQGLLVATTALPPTKTSPPVIVNETTSMAKGVYVRVDDAHQIHKGDVIALPINASAKAYLVDKLGYPQSTYLIKRVAGMEGDVMCRHGSVVTIGARTVQAARRDKSGRLLPYWSGCLVLPMKAVFLLGDHPDSFDSRYFGPVTRDEIVGRYHAVTTW